MISTGQFSVVEYTSGVGKPGPVVYRSLPLCLKDASRFAAALSYARGAYVQVAPSNGAKYQEWWLAGEFQGTTL